MTGRRRANGFLASYYLCPTRRKNANSCTNKYVTDLSVGPFVFNFIANIMRAAASITGETTEAELAKQLLCGSVFATVISIDSESLQQLLSVFRSSTEVLNYRPQFVTSDLDTQINELDTLNSRRRKLETAFSRLRSLYLFDENSMSEAEFVTQRKSLQDQLDTVNARISEINSQYALSDRANSNLSAKASYYIMSDKLLNGGEIDYEKYIGPMDQSVPRNFLLQVIDHIVVLDGRVESVTFQNGITHKFSYQ